MVVKKLICLLLFSISQATATENKSQDDTISPLWHRCKEAVCSQEAIFYYKLISVFTLGIIADRLYLKQFQSTSSHEIGTPNFPLTSNVIQQPRVTDSVASNIPEAPPMLSPPPGAKRFLPASATPAKQTSTTVAPAKGGLVTHSALARGVNSLRRDSDSGLPIDERLRIGRPRSTPPAKLLYDALTIRRPMVTDSAESSQSSSENSTNTPPITGNTASIDDWNVSYSPSSSSSPAQQGTIVFNAHNSSDQEPATGKQQISTSGQTSSSSSTAAALISKSGTPFPSIKNRWNPVGKKS